MLEEDEPLLRQKAKDCKSAEENIRYYALHAISKGKSVTDTAELFLVERQTIHDWINRWKEEKDLSNKPKPGRPESVTKDDENEMRKLIDEKDPHSHGINANIWDTKGLQEYFEKKGRYFSQETIRLHLQKMGARYVKATIVYNEGDVQKKKAHAERIMKLLENGMGPDDVLLFLDEMSSCTVPHKGYGWTFDQRLIVNTDESNRVRSNTFGAVDPIEGEVVQRLSTEAKAPALIKFYSKIYSKFSKGNIYICLDNGKVHRAKIVAKWLDRHKRMKLFYQPTYSPDVNIQEQFWHYVRTKFLNNHQFKTMHQLVTSLHWFVKRLKPEEIKRVCNFIPIETYLS